MRRVVVKEIACMITVPQMYPRDIPRRYAPPPLKGDLRGACTHRNVEEASSLFTPVASPDAEQCRVYGDAPLPFFRSQSVFIGVHQWLNFTVQG